MVTPEEKRTIENRLRMRWIMITAIATAVVTWLVNDLFDWIFH